MQIEARDALDPELAALLAQREPGERDAALPGVSFLVASLDGRAVACGGWRPLEPGVAELQRIYVRPAFRGRGVGRQLVVALEEEALAAGHPIIRLATAAHLTGAVTLYRSSGYRPIPVYGGHTGLCFEKRLAALVQ